MTQFEMLRNLGYEVVSIEGLIAELEAKSTQANKKLLDRISSMEYYTVLVNGDHFTIYSEVGNYKYEFERIAKYLGKKFIKDGSIAQENGLWLDWIKAEQSAPSVTVFVGSEFAEVLEALEAKEHEEVEAGAFVVEDNFFTDLNRELNAGQQSLVQLIEKTYEIKLEEVEDKKVKIHENGVVETTFTANGVFSSNLQSYEEFVAGVNKLKFYDLEKKGAKWKKAVLVFTKDTFKEKEYTELQRSYYIYADCKYFNAMMGGSSLYGYCLDGTDQGVRLDHYLYDGWKVDYCYILESEEVLSC